MGLACAQYNMILKNSTSFILINKTCSWINAIMTCPTVIINLSLILAIASLREWKKPCALLLLTLAITDLLNGCVNMPAFFVIYRLFGKGKFPCSIAEFSLPFFIALNIASLVTVTLIAIERYINIFHPYYHSSKISVKKVILCVCLSWLLSVSIALPFIVGVINEALNAFLATIASTSIIINIYCYFRILQRARHLRIQIRNEAARLGHLNFSSTDKRFVAIGGLIVISMVICFMPMVIDNVILAFNRESRAMEDIMCLEWTLIMINSLLNPMITCFFCPVTRRKVMKFLTCRFFCKIS